MFTRRAKRQPDPSWFVVALIGAILSMAFGYAMGARRLASVMRSETAAPRPPSATATSGYGTDRWKTWLDEDMEKGRSRYFGYAVEYPRDFDVLRGEDAKSGWIGAPRVRFSFPEDAFQDVPTNFRGASMLVSVAEDMTEDECYAEPSAGAIDRQRLAATETVNGIVFYAVTLRDAAAGGRYDTEIYRTYRAGRCLEMALNLATSNVRNYEPGTVTPFDEERAWSVLHAMRDTFRFTEPPPAVQPAAPVTR